MAGLCNSLLGTLRLTRGQKKMFAVWTPNLLEVNGQNIVTKRVIGENELLIGAIYEYEGQSALSIIVTMFSAIRLVCAILFRYCDAVYVICSRSRIGFLRDVLPLLCSRLGVRVVVHVHGSDFPILLGRPFLGLIARYLYSRCEIILPSRHLLPALASYNFRKVYTCENFCEVEDTLEDPSVHSGPRNSRIVLWNSNIMASKGFIDLVDALRQVRSDGYDVKLVVLGRVIGDYERSYSEMRHFVGGLSNEIWIDVIGAVTPENVNEYLWKTDLVALPSTYSSECQPLAVIQAMMAGRDLLVSDTAAMRATVGDYPAFFVQRNPASIASAIRSMGCVDHYFGVDEAALRSRARFSTSRFDACMREIFLSNGKS